MGRSVLVLQSSATASLWQRTIRSASVDTVLVATPTTPNGRLLVSGRGRELATQLTTFKPLASSLILPLTMGRSVWSFSLQLRPVCGNEPFGRPRLISFLLPLPTLPLVPADYVIGMQAALYGKGVRCILQGGWPRLLIGRRRQLGEANQLPPLQSVSSSRHPPRTHPRLQLTVLPQLCPPPPPAYPPHSPGAPSQLVGW